MIESHALLGLRRAVKVSSSREQGATEQENDRDALGTFLPYMIATFDWHRFIAIQLWIFVLFLVYETATELNHLFGQGELWHLLVTSRPSELPLDRRQRILELVRLSKLADAHSINEFHDPTTVAHTQLVDIVRRIAREPQMSPSME